MAKFKQPGADLIPMEHAAIENAILGGTDWIMAPIVANGVLDTMATTCLIKLQQEHWRLTSVGCACSAHAAVFYD